VEVELKLALDPSHVERFARSPLLARGRPRVTRMDGIYLDTPDCELARNAMALRIRSAGRRWVQCLKAGASGTGGLHARGEWEHAQPGPVVDLALFRDTPLAGLPSAGTLHQRLQPAFRVRFERTAWRIAPARGSRLEVALDVGEVLGGDAREALCEVEIECLDGDARHAFDLAEALLRAASLRPSAVTKAQRGYRLFARRGMRPVRAVAPRLARDLQPVQAARAVVAAGLDQLQANEEGLLASDDPEFVHQARVALRRTRSALRMFRGVIGKRRARRWRGELAVATRALGAARDWDVFATETLPALASAYGDAALGRKLARAASIPRQRARDAAREALRSRRYAAAVLHVSRWIASDGDARAAATQPLPDFAARLLRKRARRVAAGLRGLAGKSVTRRHRVRIEAKRLRYAVDGLASILDPSAARRLSARLADLQDVLGRANDAATGERLLASLEPPQAFADFAGVWLAERVRGDPAKLEGVAGRVAAARVPWEV
jgi:triphosphatase